MSDKTLIEVAKRNMEGIVPLYYEMKKALPSNLDEKTLFAGLKEAFKGNIGIYSNNISKIWNSDVFVNGTDEEKKHSLEVIKLLCAESNYSIDQAKCLYMPTRPPERDTQIKALTNKPLPAFFEYAKDKESTKLAPRNDSFVNKLNEIIPNPIINTRKVGLKKIRYEYLVNNPNIEVRVEFLKNGKIDTDKTDPLIVRYTELNQTYHYKINLKNADNHKLSLLKSDEKHDLFYKPIALEIKDELSKFGYTEEQVVDILVKYLYHIKPSRYKAALWFTYGENIYNNICRHFTSDKKVIQCEYCGEWFEVPISNRNTKLCVQCKVDKLRKDNRERMRLSRRGVLKLDETNR